MLYEKDAYIFTSESVTEGHPDKICDQISDTIVEKALEQDPNSRVACECFAGKNFLLIGGEITTQAKLDVEHIAREVIRNIGYTDPDSGFGCDTIEIINKINTQSPDIALGVDIGGAGDQGIMFGFACKDTTDLMPAPIQMAHALTYRLAEVRKQKYKDVLGPDGKAQVSVQYDGVDRVVGVDTIVVSTQHAANVTLDEVKDIVKNEVIYATFDRSLIGPDTKILVNPTGRFVIGGPMGDTGLTGRKIIVDSYGGFSRHGGGCWSGKDPTKVDRSAAYMARHIAKSIVGNHLAFKCEVQLAYAIGVAEPVAIYVDTFETAKGNMSEQELVKLVKEKFPLTPEGIIEYLNLRSFPYSRIAAYGHLGRSLSDVYCPWEVIAEI